MMGWADSKGTRLRDDLLPRQVSAERVPHMGAFLGLSSKHPEAFDCRVPFAETWMKSRNNPIKAEAGRAMKIEAIDRMGHGRLRRGSVKKHVAAIHVSGKLSLLQRKVSNVLLLNAYDDLLTKPRHKIEARTLSVMIGYDSNDIDTLKNVLRALAETTAEWDMLGDDGQQEWGVSALLSYAKLKGGVCEYAYSPALAEKLFDPKVFSLINLSVQRNFTSGHALALYENCYRFIKTGSTGWWPLPLFRRLMGLDESEYYQAFKHLNAKVIKPAVREVNKVSNIDLMPEFRREARAVVAVRFLIRTSAQATMLELGDDEGARRTAVYRALIEKGISDRLARQWIQEHGEDYVAEKIAYVEGQRKKGRIRDHGAGYLTAAIRDDYKPGVPTKKNSAPLSAEHRRAIKLAESRNPTQRDADRRQFLAQLDDPEQREEFERLGWGAHGLAAAIVAFWAHLAGEEAPLPEEAEGERRIFAKAGSVWDQVRAQYAAEEPATFRAWVAGLEAIACEAGHLTLKAPSSFVASYVERQLGPHLRRLLEPHGIERLTIAT